MPHIHDKIDFCSETFIVYKNTVLLRKHDKYNIWLSVWWHIELDEDPNEAAIREVKEEVWLDISLYKEKSKSPFFDDTISLIPPQYINKHRINDNHEHIALIYFAKSKTNKLNLSDKEISEQCKWFDKKELLKNEYSIPKNVQFYALNALKKLAK